MTHSVGRRHASGGPTTLTNVNGEERDDIELALETSWRGARARAEQGVADRLRSSAFTLFMANGFDETTVNDISRHAGVSSRTYFRYFPTKETVLIDIVDQTSDRLMTLVAAERHGHSVPIVLEAAFIRWFEEYQGLFPVVKQMSNGSRALAAAILLRQSDWEDHLVEALEARFPDIDISTLRLWGIIGYRLIRLVEEIAPQEDCSLPEAVPLAFERLAAVAQAFPRRRKTT